MTKATARLQAVRRKPFRRLRCTRDDPPHLSSEHPTSFYEIFTSSMINDFLDISIHVATLYICIFSTALRCDKLVITMVI